MPPLSGTHVPVASPLLGAWDAMPHASFTFCILALGMKVTGATWTWPKTKSCYLISVGSLPTTFPLKVSSNPPYCLQVRNGLAGTLSQILTFLPMILDFGSCGTPPLTSLFYSFWRRTDALAGAWRPGHQHTFVTLFGSQLPARHTGSHSVLFP